MRARTYPAAPRSVRLTCPRINAVMPGASCIDGRVWAPPNQRGGPLYVRECSHLRLECPHSVIHVESRFGAWTRITTTGHHSPPGILAGGDAPISFLTAGLGRRCPRVAGG